MSTNCLVRKLESEVNNDALRVLGGFYFNASVGNGRAGGFGVPLTWNIIGNGHFCSSDSYNDNIGKSVSAASDGFIYYVAEEEITIWSKDDYLLTQFNDGYNSSTRLSRTSAEWEQLKYRNLTLLNANKITGKIEEDGILGNVSGPLRINYGDIDLKALNGSTDITSINFANAQTNVSGNLSYLEDNAFIIVDMASKGSGLTGSILAFSKSINSTRITVGTSQVSGAVKDLVEAMWSNNRRSGTLEFNCYNSQCTLTHNGTDLIDKVLNITFSANNAIIVKDGNTIATWNGSSWS